MTTSEVDQADTSAKPSSSVEVNARAAARAETRMLIGGRLLEADDSFENNSPATGQLLGCTSAGTVHDMDAAIASARSAFDDSTWSTDRALRRRCLTQLQDALEAEREHIRDELIAEAGAPLMTTQIAQLEWPLADSLRYPIGLIDTFGWERELERGGVGGDDNGRVVWKEPIGVVGAITPWNFPFEIILNKLAQALAAGNTMVLKPDPNTPWTGTRIGRLVAEHTDIPAGVFNVIPTPDNSVAQALVEDRRVDMISFTGSTAVGKSIASTAAQSLKRVFLELGGKSALVVLDDADLDAAIPLMAGVCMHAGQGCGINTRAVVPRDRFDEVVTKISELFAMIRPGDPALPETFLGPVINRKQRDRIGDLLDRARSDGAVVSGGTSPTDLPDYLAGGNYLLPAIVTGVENSAEIAQLEVFGPVLVVIAHDGEDDAIRISNDSPYGLSGTVCTSSTERGLAFARRIRSGTMAVNGSTYYGADAPFGGYKQSGLGRQNGLEGFEQYLQTKAVGYPR